MFDDDNYAQVSAEQLITEASKLNDYLQRLEEQDYVTAKYKGYSRSGLTLDEINEEINETRLRLKLVNERLDDSNTWK